MLVVPLLVFVCLFGLYFPGISSAVYGGDSGDIILSAWYGGIAHAPGYPLNSLIGFLFTHLPYVATVAFKANLMAAFFQAGVLLFLFLSLRKLTKNTLASLATVLTLGFTYPFWLYAHTLEVFQLNTLLVSISVYFLVLWRESVASKKEKIKLFYLSVLFFGFAVFHHQTSVLLFPAYVFLIYKTKKYIFKKKRVFFTTIFFFLCGFLPFLYLPIASMRNIPTNWTDITTLGDFIKIITRSEYGSFVAVQQLVGSDLNSRLVQVANYLLFLKADFSFFGLAFILLGAFFLYKKNKDFFFFVLLCVLFSGPFFLFYASFPVNNDFFNGLWERFILLSYYFFALFLAFGYLFFVEILQKVSVNLPVKKQIKSIVILLLTLFIFILPIHLFSTNRLKADLSNFHLGDWLSYDLLTSAEPNSIIFLLGDTQTFNTEYIYYTNPKFKSLKIVRSGSISDYYYRKRFVKRYPTLNYSASFLDSNNHDGAKNLKSLIEENKDQFPIYIVADPAPIENRKWMASGLLKKLVKEDQYSKEDLLDLNKQLFSNFKYNDYSLDLGYNHFMVVHLKEAYYGANYYLATELIRNGQQDEAIYYLNQAELLLPDEKEAHELLGNEYLAKKDCEKAKESFQNVFEIDNKDYNALYALSRVFNGCYDDKQMGQKYSQKAEDLKNKITKNNETLK